MLKRNVLKPPLFIDNERVLKASFNFVQARAQRSFFPEKGYDTIRILQSWRPVPQLGNGALREPWRMGTRWRNFLLPTITTDWLWIVFADLLVQNNVRKKSAVRMKKYLSRHVWRTILMKLYESGLKMKAPCILCLTFSRAFAKNDECI